MTTMTATKTTRTTISERNDRVRGTVSIIQEGSRSFVVERSDMNGTYDRMAGFRTLNQAKAEARCYY